MCEKWCQSQLLEVDTLGKIGGRPGNAFELVYRSTTDAVRRKMHAVDPTLCEWVRCAKASGSSTTPATPEGALVVKCGWFPAVACRLHLYGDVYSSPGLRMAQKQILMVAFLAEADMHEQLFGHSIAVSSLWPRHFAGHSQC